MTEGISLLLNEMNGAVRWLLTEAAIRMGIFDELSEWKNAEDIAINLETDAEKTALFLDALSSCGYLEKYCGRYINTDMSTEYLVTSSPFYQGEVVLSLAERRLTGLDDIPALLRNETPPVMPLKDEKVWESALNNLVPYQKALGKEAARLVRGLEGSENFTSVLDLGGGPGFFGQAVAAELPGVKLTLFDLPRVIKLAEEKSENKDIRYIAGDYSEADFGTGYDLIWASRSLYYAKDLTALLKRASDALKPGGWLITLHEGLFNEKTGPAEVILNRIGVAMGGSDVSFQRGEMEKAAADAGLRVVSVKTGDFLGGISDLMTARKI